MVRIARQEWPAKEPHGGLAKVSEVPEVERWRRRGAPRRGVYPRGGQTSWLAELDNGADCPL
jgi:hypothetical protein